MERCAPVELFERLEEALGVPVFVCAASWRPDIAVDLDEAAARVLVDHLEEQAAEEVALVLIGRGGAIGFADLVARVTKRYRAHAVVPYLATGAVSLAAISCATLRIGKYGALGAVDVPTFDRRSDNLAVHLHAGRRLLGESTAELSFQRLGASTGLDSSELSELGLDARPLESRADEAAWALFQAYEQALGLREAPGHRYQESDVGDEVEWEFATGIPGAFVESAAKSTAFLLDTGKPDPDTGRFDGAWQLSDEEEVLELDFDNATPA